MKSDVSLENAYDIIPYYIIEDAGLPMRPADLTNGQATFLMEVMRISAEESQADFKSLISDLHAIKSDLEGVLHEFEE